MLNKIKLKTLLLQSAEGTTLPHVMTVAVFASVAIKEPEVVAFLKQYKTDMVKLETIVSKIVEDESKHFAKHFNEPNQYATSTKLQVYPAQELLDILAKAVEVKGTKPTTFADFIIVGYSLYETGTKSMAQFLNALKNSGFDFDTFLNPPETAQGQPQVPGQESDASILKSMYIDMTEMARQGKYDNLIGREDEVLRLCEVFGKYRKNNIVMIGKAGVGKTVIAEGLALMIVKNDPSLPETLKGAEIYSLDTGDIVAGTKFRGDFEKKIQLFLKFIRERKAAGKNPIVFVDEIHTVIGAGSVGGAIDMGEMLKPALARGEMRCLGACTKDEFMASINKDKALRRRFSTLTIEEPSVDDTIKILLGVKDKYEKHNKLQITDEAVVRAVYLADEYIKDSARPDKTIDLMDTAAAMMKVRGVTIVGPREIEEAVTRITKVPLLSIRETMDKKEKEMHKPLAPRILEEIFGQDEAVNRMTEILEMGLAGFKEEGKNLGNFLFLGPTGTGKTELAKVLTKVLGEGTHFERIDLSEFSEKSAVAKLVGSPPGYVGFDQPSRLSVIKDKPRTVLLLDEVEKAHPDVHALFLQAMDNAKITDSQGEEIDMRNTIIIMTSNAGAKEIQASALGLGDGRTVQKSKNKAAIENMFTPEFRGRLDAIMHFNKLGAGVVDKIVIKTVKELEQTTAFKRSNIKIDITQAAVKHILKQEADASLGARPIKGNVKKLITVPLSKIILYGTLKEGDKHNVLVDEKDGEISFSYS